MFISVVGKFGQRNNMKQNRYVKSPQEFFKMWVDKSKKIQDFHIINDDTLHVEWSHEDTFEPDSLMTNEVIATFTTCWARLELYKVRITFIRGDSFKIPLL